MGRMQEAGPGTSSVVSSLDPDSLTYTVQHQVLGSDQWTALVTGLREPAWAATGLKKGLQHIFRVLSTSGKSSSKPSAPSEPVQLVEHGEPDAMGVGGGGGGGGGVSDRGLKAAPDLVTMAWMVSLGRIPSHQQQWSGYKAKDWCYPSFLP